MPKAKTEKKSKKASKKPQSNSKKTQKKVVAKRPAKQKVEQPPRKMRKIDQVVELLSRPEGANMKEIVALTGWQEHTARGAISASIRKDKGYNVTAEKGHDGKRIYKIVS